MVHKQVGLLAAVGIAALLAQPSPARAQTGADLHIAITHRGNFTVGVQGVYTIVITNVGGTVAAEPIGVYDPLTSLPFTFVSGVGAGWSCDLVEHGPPVGATVTCLSLSVVPPGASGFPITLTVIPTVSGTWTNTVQVLGEQPFTNPAGSDVTIVVAAVPTLPQWTLIALTTLLALAGVAALSRRRTSWRERPN